MYQKPYTQINASSSSLHAGLLQKAIILSGLTWGMPPAQVCQMHLNTLMNPVSVTTEIKEDRELHKVLTHTQTPTYLMGIPVVIDKNLPNSVVQLRWNGAVLFTIECLAIPVGFE